MMERLTVKVKKGYLEFDLIFTEFQGQYSSTAYIDGARYFNATYDKDYLSRDKWLQAFNRYMKKASA